MLGLRPSAPTRPDDYLVDRAGRPLRNTRVWPRGLTPRRLAQLAGADPRGVQHVAPDPWVPEPALVLSDVVASPEPWMGMLLDPARPRPVPIGSLVRSAGPPPARHWLVWPDARLRPAQGLDGDGSAVRAPPTSTSPSMAHFARELDRAAVAAAVVEPGRRPARHPRPRRRMRRRGRLRQRRRGGRRRDGMDRRNDPPGDPEGQPPRRASRARPAAPPRVGTQNAGWCADGSSDDGDPRTPMHHLRRRPLRHRPRRRRYPPA